MTLRQLARGRACLIRLPGFCTGGGEDTVLAHYRLAGTCGMGMKPPDVNACPACMTCHDIADGRRKTNFSRDFVRFAHAEGCLRWNAWLAEQGWRLVA